MAKIAKNLSISLLFDFYGAMLTEKQREVVDFYYNEDLSLAEIANLSGITRQGVRDSIKRAEKQLIDCEEKLGLYSKFHVIQEQLDKIKALAQEIQAENRNLVNSKTIGGKITKIIEIADDINI